MVCYTCGSGVAPSDLSCPRCGSPVETRAIDRDAEREDSGATTRPASADLLPGAIVAERYRIIRLLGRGAIGAVYQALDEKLATDVALKILAPSDFPSEAGLKLLIRDINSARKVTHENVCRVFDIGHDAARDLHFITMELVEGPTLEEHLARVERLTWEEMRPIAVSVCRGLAAAHEKGVVHRDIKPSNILLGGGGALLADFSCARSATDDKSSWIVGTPLYMAPEQSLGEAGPTADVFSLGVVLFRALTGKTQLELSKLERDLDECGVDRSLSAIIRKCLALNAPERHPDGSALLAALEGRAPTFGERPRRALAGVAAALVAGAVAIALLWDRAPRVRPSVAVVYFENRADESNDWLETGLSEMLTTELGRLTEYRVVAGDRVAEMLRNLELAPRSQYDAATVKTALGFLRAEYLVTGAVYAVEDRLRAEFQIRSRDGAILGTGSSEAKGEAAFLDVAAELGEELRNVIAPRSLPNPSAPVLISTRDAYAFYAEGVRASREGRYLEARPLLQAAVDRDPSFVPAHLALSVALNASGYDKSAAQAAERAFLLSRQLPEEQRLRIEARYRAAVGDFESAREAYRRLTSLRPDDSDSLMETADFLLEASFFTEAERLADDLVAREGENPGVLLLQARSLVEQSRNDDARAPLERARELYRDQGSREGEARVLLLMARLAFERAELDSALASYEEARSMARAIGDRLTEVTAISGIGNIHEYQSRYDEALQAHEDALAVSRDMGNRKGEAAALVAIGNSSFRLGRHQQAIRFYESSRSLGEEIGDLGIRIASLNGLGHVLKFTGDLEGSVKAYEEAYSIASKVGDRDNMAKVLNNLGVTRRAAGDLRGALAAYKEGLDIAREVGDRHLAAACSLNVGYIRYLQMDDSGALEAFQDARDTFEELGIPRGLSASLSGVGTYYYGQENWPKALETFRQSLDIARETGDIQAIVLGLGNIGEVLYWMGQNDESRRHLQEAMEVLEQTPQSPGRFPVAAFLSALDVREGRRDEGLSEIRRIVAAADREGESDFRARARRLLGSVLTESGMQFEARQVLEEGLEIARSLSLTREEVRIKELLARLDRT